MVVHSLCLFQFIRFQCIIIIILIIITKHCCRSEKTGAFFLQDGLIFKTKVSELKINSRRTPKSYVSFRKIEVSFTCRILKSQGTFEGTYCLLIRVKF